MPESTRQEQIVSRFVRTAEGRGGVRLSEQLRADTGSDFRAVLTHAVRRGGLRLKLIGMSTLIILATVGALSYFFVNLMERSITEKAFEVVQSSLDRIGDLSTTALLERSPESRVNVEEMLRQVQASHIRGLLDVALYATEKSEAGSLSLSYFAGFSEKEHGLMDGALSEQILKTGLTGTLQQRIPFTEGAKPVDAYRFVKPVRFDYRGKQHLLGVVLLAYDREAIVGPVREVVGLAALTTAAVLLVSVLFAYAMGRRLSRPIITVAHAAVEVARGNLNVELDISTNDEIEELGHEFNRMVQGLREKEKMLKYMSGSTVEMIRSGGDNEVRLGGDHKSLTFLFSDIRGFTALSEQKPPAEVVGIINFYLNLQTEIIRKHGGDIDKFIGDAVMAAFFGKYAIERAIDAAVEIQEAIRKANRERDAARLPTVEVGIGINYGRVLVGNIGSYDRMDFTSIGSAVNLASRLCAEAGPFEVLVDRRVYALTERSHPVEDKGAIEVKGFSQPIEVLSVTG